VQLNAGSVLDAASNMGPALAVSSTTITIDRSDVTSPAADWTSIPSTPNNSPADTGITYTLTFLEAVSDFTAADLTNTGTATGCSFVVGASTGNAYPVTVTGCSEGTVVVQLNAGSVLDAASNMGPAANTSAAVVVIHRNTVVTKPESTPTVVPVLVLKVGLSARGCDSRHRMLFFQAGCRKAVKHAVKATSAHRKSMLRHNKHRRHSKHRLVRHTKRRR